MTTIGELLEDVDDAFDELLQLDTADSKQQRRCLRSVLAAMYEVRCHVKDELGHDAYFAEVNASDAGRITEGVLVIRGRLTHGALDDLQPSVAMAFPGPKFIPSEYTYPGSNLTWLELNAMTEPTKSKLVKRDTKNRYADHVGGYMVFPTLYVARQFLREQVAELKEV